MAYCTADGEMPDVLAILRTLQRVAPRQLTIERHRHLASLPIANFRRGGRVASSTNPSTRLSQVPCRW